MSVTIDTNNLKFVIFGSGHDYTLLDSGEGEKVFFSHPFVPLNSVNYAGQYYFEVPDENGDFFDAVKDDMAHITFDPALGTTFDTEGEIEVSVHYRREYIYPEETILVEKELKQTITVVDHGNIVVNAQTSGKWRCSDIYEDGYAFLRPKNVNNLDEISYCLPYQSDLIKKVSSFWWRVETLGYSDYYGGFLKSNNLEDISELAYADTSHVTSIIGLLYECSANVDLTPLEDWDVSNVSFMGFVFQSATGITTLHGLEKWDVSNVNSLENAFYLCGSLADVSALSDWNVSNITSLKGTFWNCTSLTDLSPLKDWDVSSVTTMENCFRGIGATSLHGLEDWDVSSVDNMKATFSGSMIESVSALSEWRPTPTTIESCFSFTKLKTLLGLEKFDVSGTETFTSAFATINPLLSLDGLEDWDVSSGKYFTQMFYQNPWLEDISALADWNTSNALDLRGMFGQSASILAVSDLNTWDFSLVTNMTTMFVGFSKWHSTMINKDVFQNAYYYYDYQGTQYTNSQVESEGEPLQIYSKNAIGSENWNVSLSGVDAFDSKWSNIPSWN